MAYCISNGGDVFTYISTLFRPFARDSNACHELSKVLLLSANAFTFYLLREG